MVKHCLSTFQGMPYKWDEDKNSFVPSNIGETKWIDPEEGHVAEPKERWGTAWMPVFNEERTSIQTYADNYDLHNVKTHSHLTVPIETFTR